MIELPEEPARIPQDARGMVEELQQERTPEHEEAVVGLALIDDHVTVHPIEHEKGNDEQHRQADVRGELLTHDQECPGSARRRALSQPCRSPLPLNQSNRGEVSCQRRNGPDHKEPWRLGNLVSRSGWAPSAEGREMIRIAVTMIVLAGAALPVCAADMDELRPSVGWLRAEGLRGTLLHDPIVGPPRPMRVEPVDPAGCTAAPASIALRGWHHVIVLPDTQGKIVFRLKDLPGQTHFRGSIYAVFDPQGNQIAEETVGRGEEKVVEHQPKPGGRTSCCSTRDQLRAVPWN